MTTRQEKVRELLKEEISIILQRELKDPRIGFVTVTDVDVTPDLRQAKVFVSILGTEEERKENMAILKRSERFVRQALSKKLTMKMLPEIEFKVDTSVDKGIKILELLEQIKRDDKEESS